MTDTPAPATPATPEPAPLMFYQGQPISREAAAEQLQQLRDDPKFQERIAARDAEAFAENTRLWRLAHGMTPEPEPPQSPVQVDAEADARVVAAVQQHAGFYRDRGYSELQQIEIVGNRPITVEEKRWHETQYNMKKSSAAFMAKWSSGDLDAIKQMNDHAIAMRLPLGTLADIQRWKGE